MHPITAIEEAQQHKREIETLIQTELIAFTKRTGLLVSDLRISAVETTNMGDAYRKFGDYRVEVVVTV